MYKYLKTMKFPGFIQRQHIYFEHEKILNCIGILWLFSVYAKCFIKQFFAKSKIVEIILTHKKREVFHGLKNKCCEMIQLKVKVSKNQNLFVAKEMR